MLELAVEQAKIEDQIFVKYNKEFMLFIKACRHYGFMKSNQSVATVGVSTKVPNPPLSSQSARKHRDMAS